MKSLFSVVHTERCYVSSSLFSSYGEFERVVLLGGAIFKARSLAVLFWVLVIVHRGFERQSLARATGFVLLLRLQSIIDAYVFDLRRM